MYTNIRQYLTIQSIFNKIRCIGESRANVDLFLTGL